MFICGPSIRLFCLQLLAWGCSVWDRPWSEGTKPDEGCRVLQGWFNNSTLHTKAISVATLVGDACLPGPIIVYEKGCGNNRCTQPVNDCSWDVNSGHPEAKSCCCNLLICQILFQWMIFSKSYEEHLILLRDKRVKREKARARSHARGHARGDVPLSWADVWAWLSDLSFSLIRLYAGTTKECVSSLCLCLSGYNVNGQTCGMIKAAPECVLSLNISFPTA